MFIVFYTKKASSCIKKFKTLSSAQKFADKHELKNEMFYSDDWVDCIIQGKVVKTYSNWYGKTVKEK